VYWRYIEGIISEGGGITSGNITREHCTYYGKLCQKGNEDMPLISVCILFNEINGKIGR
jgi:hypothetical protein